MSESSISARPSSRAGHPIRRPVGSAPRRPAVLPYAAVFLVGAACLAELLPALEDVLSIEEVERIAVVAVVVILSTPAAAQIFSVSP